VKHLAMIFIGTEPRLQLRGGQLNINLLGGGHLVKFCLIWDQYNHILGAFLEKTISIGGGMAPARLP
jgi:hypothetical protein